MKRTVVCMQVIQPQTQVVYIATLDLGTQDKDTVYIGSILQSPMLAMLDLGTTT